MWWEASNAVPSVDVTQAHQALEKMPALCLLGALNAPRRHSGKKEKQEKLLES